MKKPREKIEIKKAEKKLLQQIKSINDLNEAQVPSKNNYSLNYFTFFKDFDY